MYSKINRLECEPVNAVEKENNPVLFTNLSRHEMPAIYSVFQKIFYPETDGYLLIPSVLAVSLL
jgi:hypothetical protein